MRRFVASAAVISSLLVPASSFALEGIGPRVTVTGAVTTVTITEKQKFEEQGGEYIMTAQNGQTVTVVLDKDTTIISEGKLSRKQLLPVNVMAGMQIRVRGWRVNSNTLTASLVVILNAELNPSLSYSGTLQSIGDGTVTVLTADGQNRTYSVTNETQVNVSYDLYGRTGLSLIGKQVLLTVNPLNPSQIKVLRITGDPGAVRAKPSTVDLRMR